MYKLVLFLFLSSMAAHANDFSRGQLAVDKKTFLQVFRTNVVAKTCSDKKSPMRICYSYSDSQCQAMFASPVKLCSQLETKDLPDPIHYNTDKDLGPIRDKITKCATQKFMADNNNKALQTNCPQYINKR